MEVAAYLTEKAHSVSVVELEEVPFQKFFGEKVGRAILKVTAEALVRRQIPLRGGGRRKEQCGSRAGDAGLMCGLSRPRMAGFLPSSSPFCADV